MGEAGKVAFFHMQRIVMFHILFNGICIIFTQRLCVKFANIIGCYTKLEMFAIDLELSNSFLMCISGHSEYYNINIGNDFK